MLKHTTLTLSLIVTMLVTACTTTRIIKDDRTPELTINNLGHIYFHDEQVSLGNIGKTIKRTGLYTNQEVKILIPENPDRHLMGAISADLLQSGYTRTIFITNRTAKSAVLK